MTDKELLRSKTTNCPSHRFAFFQQTDNPYHTLEHVHLWLAEVQRWYIINEAFINQKSVIKNTGNSW